MTDLAPYARMLGLMVEDHGDAPVLVMPFGDDLVGRPGYLHGGAIGGVLEMAAIVALRHALGDDAVTLKPINVTVDYRRGGRDRPTRAQGRVTRLGQRIANVEARAWQDEPDRPIAEARMLVLLRR